MSARRLLVTGATAPFGRAVLDALLADPSTELVLATGHEPPAWPTADPRVMWRPADLTRPRELRDLLQGEGRALGVEAVVHTAQHRDARDTGERVHAINVEATRALLAVCESHPTIRSFVFRSFGHVYRLDPSEPVLIAEDEPLDFSAEAPQWVRDRVEADVTVCVRLAQSPLRIVVLRLAEVLAPETGSQLWDWLRTSVVLRPLGFDPMLNLLSLEDAVQAVRRAVQSDARGVFNIPGADTLPLSQVVRRAGRRNLPVPGPLLAPAYRLRATTRGMEFRYDLNYRRFHFSGVLDGTRAKEELGYVPEHPLVWPPPGL